MRRFTKRLEKAEQAVGPGPVLVHATPNQSDAQALAAYERAHGKIPPDARVILIRHTFKSAL